jgi:hypothetical protein
MDVTGRSTVQFHSSVGSRRAYACLETGFSSQNGDRASVVYHRRATLFCAFLWKEKELNAKDIHIEMFPVYGGKCLSRKAVHSWVANVWLMTKTLKLGSEVVETTVKRLLCCGCRRTGKAMGQAYQCWWRICREINFFPPGSNITCFTFYIHLWLICRLSIVCK